MSEKGTNKHAPVVLRAFKKESELEIWKQNAAGEYILLKTYPMCRWSGQLGPKVREGDRQVPEGFYSITPTSLNPNSSFYLSFNVGYPNAYDRAHGRTGSAIMVHGACSSAGCFSMTDEQIAEIYAITREAFAGGQKAIQLQSYPFRFTTQNLAKFRADPHMPFWKMLKEGSDSFELSKQEVQVSVCEARYAFNRGQRTDGSPVCGPQDGTSPLVQAVAAKARSDEQKVAELAASGVGAVRRIYKDGDQHPAFRTTHFAATDSEGRTIASPRSSASRVAEVSRPDALDHGPVEVAVDSLKGRGQAPAAALARTNLATQAPALPSPPPVVAAPATPAAPSANAFSPTVTGNSSIFRGLLGGSPEPSRPDVVTAVEPDRPQPVRIPLPPRAPQRQAGQPAAPLEAAPAEIPNQPSASFQTVLKGFNALIPGMR
ncbi:MAG TPA: murein L,D-transpeptidase family protein [Beijerinckiaceae bacterium]|nr:murein L,D-transpeptidase family protein [Beijerinckiaceae bacterium]